MRPVLEVVSATNESQNHPIWTILELPATDTLQHKTLPIYSNRMARSKRCLIYTVALSKGCEIGRDAKFLDTLINKKWPPGINLGGHHFVVLNVSIKKKPYSVLEVVIYRNTYLTQEYLEAMGDSIPSFTLPSK